MKKMKRHFQFKLKSGSGLNTLNEGNLMDVCQKQFFKQQAQLVELQCQMRTFTRDMMHVTDTVENMYSSFKSVYEPHWVGNLEFNQIFQDSIKIWRQYIADFKFNISKIIDDYGGEFLNMKRAIDKRNKKLNELNRHQSTYDSQRNAKKIDQVKVQKTQMELKNVDQEFRNLNDALKDSLPKFCDKRIGVYVEFWEKMTEAEEAMFSFLRENRKNQLRVLKKLRSMVGSEEYSILSQVTVMNTSGTNLLSTKNYTQSVMAVSTPPRPLSKSSSFVYDNYEHIADMTSKPAVDHDQNIRTTSYQVQPVSKNADDKAYTNFFSISKPNSNIQSQISTTFGSKPPKTPSHKSKSPDNGITNRRSTPLLSPLNPYDICNGDDDSDDDDSNPYSIIKKTDKTLHNDVEKSEVHKIIIGVEIGDVYAKINDNLIMGKNKVNHRNGTSSSNCSETGNPYASLEDDQCYNQVRVTHDYQAVGQDELTLHKKDIIMILPWNSEEQMDVGWRYGENVITKEKGFFPENHTKIF